jgi:glycosyltransferase involved in cell wall biosynthesis
VTDISVVVPTHNRSAWLRQTLRSVLAQADVDLEVIVVDDGSTDDTGEMVGRLPDPRLALLRHDTSLGLSAARNHGAEEATGEWLAFIDDDDLWSPHKLNRQLLAANTAGCSWAYTGCVNVDSMLRILGGSPPPPPADVARRIFRSNLIPGGGSNVAVRRDAFRRVGPFDVGLKSAEDWEMWIRLAKQGPPAWVPEPLIGYRLHSTNMSLDAQAILDAIASIERRHGIRAARGPLYRWIAASCLRTGQRAAALKYFAFAAARGQARGVAADVRAAIGWRVDRALGRTPKTLHELPHPEWTAQAQGWLSELALGSAVPDGS